MPRLDSSSSGLNQKRIKNEVIVPVNQKNLGTGMGAFLFESFRAVRSRKSAPQNDNARPLGGSFEFHALRNCSRRSEGGRNHMKHKRHKKLACASCASCVP